MTPLPMIDPLVGFALMLCAFTLGLIGGVRLIGNSHPGSRMPMPPSSTHR